MKHFEFRIGLDFVCGGRTWRCTDRGQRTITAVCLEAGPDWLSGPPYAVSEVVFDENDQVVCTQIPTDRVRLFFKPLTIAGDESEYAEDVARLRKGLLARDFMVEAEDEADVDLWTSTLVKVVKNNL